jgi:hypothetical protein
MSWARYDDELPMNRKIGALMSQGVNGPAALGLHLLANTWARHNGTAGFVPTHQPGLLVGDARLGRKLAHLLTSVSMFDSTDGGWMIHDYDDYSDPNDDGRPAAEKKKDLSAKRAAAGSKGGKQTASKRDGLLPANDQHCSSPEPVPVPSEYVRDHSTSENTARGVDISRRDATLNAYADLALEQAEGTGTEIRSYDAYKRKARSTAAAMPDLQRWLDMFPDAPPNALACWLMGDKHSMAYYTRADELATVHTLPGRTA